MLIKKLMRKYCDQFSMQGLSAQRLRIRRVQLITHERAADRDSWNDPHHQQGSIRSSALNAGSKFIKNLIDDVWMSADATSGRWSFGHVTYSSPNEHAFLFEAVADTQRAHFAGYVAVDDVRLVAGPCDRKKFQNYSSIYLIT